MAGDFDTEGVKQHFGDGATGDAGGTFPGTGTLQYVTRVGEVVLQTAGEVSVARTRTGHGFVLSWIASFNGEDFFPVLPVIIGDGHRDRRANGFAVAHTTKDVSCIALDAHTPAAAIAFLTAPKFAIQKGLIDRDACRQSAD